MLDSEYVCLIFLLLLNSQNAKTLAIIMYSNIPICFCLIYVVEVRSGQSEKVKQMKIK